MRNKKMICKMCALCICVPLIGALLMIAVYMLPTERMKGHIANSDDIFNYEGIYPQIIGGYKSSQLDNYTDALMYATAIHESSGNAVHDAMVNGRYEYADDNMVQSLNDYANDVHSKDDLRYEIIYPRYWHGYLVVLKPLLVLFDAGDIRMLNVVIQGSLLVLLLYLIRKRIGERYQLPVILMVAVLNPVVLPLSLQFSWVYYVSLISSVALLLMKKHILKKNDIFFFLIVGMLTSYVDLLTYPLITLGLPLVLYLLLDEGEGWKIQLAKVVKCGFIWAVGYAVMWAGKWVLCWVLSGNNLAADVISEMLFRVSMTGESEEVLTIGMVLERNLGVLCKGPYLLLLLLFLGSCILRRKRSGRKESGWQQRFVKVLPYLAIMLLPIAWLIVLSNHSWVHYWFTYRELSVTVLAGGTAVMELCVPPVKSEIVKAEE